MFAVYQGWKWVYLLKYCAWKTLYLIPIQQNNIIVIMNVCILHFRFDWKCKKIQKSPQITLECCLLLDLLMYFSIISIIVRYILVFKFSATVHRYFYCTIHIRQTVPHSFDNCSCRFILLIQDINLQQQKRCIIMDYGVLIFCVFLYQSISTSSTTGD